MAKKKKDRLTIGLVIEWIDTEYEFNILRAVNAVAKKRDVNLLCFEDGSLYLTHLKNPEENLIYKRVQKEELDGLIISIGSISNFVENERIKQFIDLYPDLPIVSCAYDMPGFPSVTVDNSSGMENLVKHLIEVHKYTKLAFIKGPSNNYDAEQRYQAFIKSLKEHDIEIDDNLIVEGEFSYDCGINAIKELLDERKAEFEVLVAADGSIASGVLFELSAKGINVPSQMAVVSFDDEIDYSGYSIPPLTTVRLPINEMGELSAELLLDILDGKEVQEKIILPPTMIIRESCGCHSGKKRIPVTLNEGPADEERAILKDNKYQIIDEIVDETRELFFDIDLSMVREEAENLFDSYFEVVLNDKSDDVFLNVLYKLLHHDIWKGSGLFAWKRIVSLLLAKFSAQITSHKKLFIMEFLRHEAMMLITDKMLYEEKFRQNESRKKDDTFDLLFEEILLTPDMKKQIDLLSDKLPQFGFKNFYLATYEWTSEVLTDKKARLIFAYTNRKRVAIKDNGISVEPSELIPDNIGPDDRYTLFITALGFLHEQLGYIVFEIDMEYENVYSSLFRIINNILLEIILFSKIQDQAKFLTAQQVQLMQADKLVSLGTLVAGVAHEINNPNNSIMLNSELNDDLWKSLMPLMQELIDENPNVRIKNQPLTDVIEDINNSFPVLIRNSRRIKQIVDDLKNYARKDVGNIKEDIEINLLTEAAIRLVNNLINKTTNHFSVNYATDIPIIKGNAQRLEQVIINVIQNACHALPDKNKSLCVSTSYDRQSDNVIIAITDEGIGMDNETIRRVFDPFYTTKRSTGGTGLGLSVSERIIKDHQGLLEIISEVNSGTTVKILLPVNKDIKKTPVQ